MTKILSGKKKNFKEIFFVKRNLVQRTRSTYRIGQIPIFVFDQFWPILDPLVGENAGFGQRLVCMSLVLARHVRVFVFLASPSCPLQNRWPEKYAENAVYRVFQWVLWIQDHVKWPNRLFNCPNRFSGEPTETPCIQHFQHIFPATCFEEDN